MSRTAAALALSFLLGAPLSAAQEPDAALPLTERERAVHALSRLAYGPRPGDLERVLEVGVEAWIEQQLAPAPDPVLEDRLARYPSLGLPLLELLDTYWQPVEEGDSAEVRREKNRKENEPRRELLEALLVCATESPNQLEEVLADFWRNHFNVSYTKGGPARFLLTDWEREVIRRHALGSFLPFLEATAQHPAMLHYLDNASSRRPPSKQELAEIERRVRRRTGSRERGEEAAALALQRGLNENYARELLELHTLGVDNYYKQKDVVAVAEALTGWTYNGGRNGDWSFRFRNDMHATGDKRVLGRRVRAEDQDGLSEGMQVLEMLSGHQGTADFIALKLCRYLIADEPPQRAVDAAAKAFRRSDGDIPAVVRAIVESEDFWARENYRAKFKTPYEFVLSALRATGARVDEGEAVMRRLIEMGQGLYLCDDPTGWYDTAESWLDPGVMALRWQFALDLASGSLRGVSIPTEFWDEVPESLPPRLWQHHLTKMILPGGAGPRTRAALSSVTDEYLARAAVPDVRELGPELVGLLLGSPEFQQQ
jgi:uncharacterized protein (DUF1800 family)